MKKTTQAALARELGISQQFLSQCVRGICRPSHPIRLALERKGIPADSWLDSREREIAKAA